MKNVDKKYTIDDILHYLNTNMLRASYHAVAEYLGISVWSLVYQLDKSHPETSWLVSEKTGLPISYDQRYFHPQLFDKGVVLSTASVLKSNLLRYYM